jgi:hypothetical protein
VEVLVKVTGARAQAEAGAEKFAVGKGEAVTEAVVVRRQPAGVTTSKLTVYVPALV